MTASRQYSDFLHETILEAGRLSLEYREQLATLQIDRKSPKDLVTEADVAVERLIVDRIKGNWPEHGIIGEESGHISGDEYNWIIDPIDGTVSFVRQQPFYSISVALEHKGQTIVAAVYAPVLGELFEAVKSEGATLNDKPIKVSNIDQFVNSSMSTGFACLRQDKEYNNLGYFSQIAPQIMGMRRYGSAAVDLCYVACGRIEAFWELNLNIYDVAAGILIVEEAGGKVTDFAGRPLQDCSEILATNGHMHEKMVEELRKVRMNIRPE